MWRMMPRLATAALLATLAMTAGNPSRADASTVQSFSYSTYGNIDAINGATPVTFNGISGGTQGLTTPGSFSLGQFVANPLPSSGTVTYNNTPFTVDLWVKDVVPPGQVAPGALLTNSDYTVSGVLNGTYTGSGTSNMVATVNSITGGNYGTAGSPPFPTSLLTIAPLAISAPDGASPGYSSLIAQVAPSSIGLPAPAPEPTSVAAFVAAIAGWAIRRRYKNREKAGGGETVA